MRFIKSLLPCLVVLLVIGCTKPADKKIVSEEAIDNNQSSEYSVPKIKKVDYGDGTSATYFYDTQGRLIAVQELHQKTEYIYTADSKVVMRVHGSCNTLTAQGVYALNSQGLARSYIPDFPAGSSSQVIGYNSNRQITRRIQTMPASLEKFDTRYYYGSDGKLDSLIQEHTNTAGRVNSKYKLSYAYSYVKPYTIGNENTGQGFLGKETTRTWDKELYNDLLDPFYPEEVTNYEYEVDAQDRVIKQSRITPPPSVPLILKYTYY